ncbi:MAG: DUF2339 domain-containing protein [Pseudomonadota bacterium]
MELVFALVVLVGGGLLLGARSRIGHVEYRLRLVEDELRRRIAAHAALETRLADLPPLARDAVPRAAPPPPPHEAVVAESTPDVETAAIEDAPVPPATEPPNEPAVSVADLSDQSGVFAEDVAAAGPVPEPTARRRASINFEELFGRRLPIWAGGITLAIAGVLIVRYAIDQGFFARIFTPGVQVVCGLLFGLGLIGGAEWAWRQRERVGDPRVGQALAGAGISTLYAALLVAANLYHLIAPLAAFAGLAVVTGASLWLALRHGAPAALLGLVGGLAAPALTFGPDANVPLLAVYLGLTVAGLAGVSRQRRWPWLAALALAGGAGWSLWLILAGRAFATLDALAVGALVGLMALAVPLFTLTDAARRPLRAVSAIVGAAQLGLLVALGGFAPLHWGLFVLIAAAGQFLAWREASLAIVPTLGAALSVLLLLIWPDPLPSVLIVVALALAAIHAAPLLARLWQEPAVVQRSVELAAIGLAAPLVALRHGEGVWDGHALAVAVSALAGAALTAAGAAAGWQSLTRGNDRRLAVLLASTGVLLVLAAWFALPHWQAPLWTGLVALAFLALGPKASDWRVERLAAAFGALAVLLLAMTFAPDRGGEFAALFGIDEPASGGLGLLRWGGLALASGVFAARAQTPMLRHAAQAFAALLAYGFVAQALPQAARSVALPLLVPAALAIMGWWCRAGRRIPLAGAAMLFVLSLCWAFLPLVVWLNQALQSLGGVPMTVNDADLAVSPVLRRLAAPALLFVAAAWSARGRLPRPALAVVWFVAGGLGIIALHTLYRHGFAAVAGSDFVTAGLAQRLGWIALVGGAGTVLWWRYPQDRAGKLGSPVLAAAAALHVLVYSLVLHNPLWSAQHVGVLPVLNLLIPLFAALPLALLLLQHCCAVLAGAVGRIMQPVLMVSVIMFCWASLRQSFHGTLLVAPGVSDAEDILRSILGIALAIAFLLWGIRSGRRDWRLASLGLMLAAVVKVFVFDASGLEGLLRIGSFVALGFSLIGIGWLYSRQLRAQGPMAD